MVAAHLIVDDPDLPEIAAVDRHHVERVLRVRAGEEVTVTDGAGRWRRCRYVSGGGLEPVGPVAADPRPSPPIVIGFALTKGDRPDVVVQKLTECGVDRIVPFVAGRSVVRWDEAKAANHARRWEAIVREAVMQSRRTWVPTIDPVSGFDDVVSRFAGAGTGAGPDRLVLADAAGAGTGLAGTGAGPPASCPCILVGPEGGWTDAERSSVTGRVALGPHVLRAETAAIAAAALLAALRAGIVGHGGA